jgi:hypothetical protein
MQLIQAEDFSGKAVVLDGKHFHDCRFNKTTTLIYEGGEWAETNCTFEPGIRLSFDGAAARTMQVMVRFGMMRQIPMPIPQRVPAKAPSGNLQ